MYDEILVLDFGSQYNQLIARRIREFGVFSELKPYDISIEEIKSRPNLKGIIFSGGPNSVYDKNALYCDKEIYKLGIPILGICYGMQLMSFDLGGKIEPSNEREYGGADITCKTDNLFFDGLNSVQTVWMSHGDKVTRIPDGFVSIAQTDNCPYAAMYN